MASPILWRYVMPTYLFDSPKSVKLECLQKKEAVASYFVEKWRGRRNLKSVSNLMWCDICTIT